MCIVKIFWYSYSGSQYFASKIQAMIHLQVPLEFPATLGEGDLWLIKMQTLHKRFINSTASVHLWNSNTFAKIFLLKAYLYFYADLCSSQVIICHQWRPTSIMLDSFRLGRLQEKLL